MKAIVALEHAILSAAWHMLTTGELYLDPGADYFTRRAPAKARAIGQLEALGYQVTITPANEPSSQHSAQAFQQPHHVRSPNFLFFDEFDGNEVLTT